MEEEKKMETRERNNSTNQQENALKDSSWYDHFKNVSNPLMARYVYALIFLVSNVLAWATRDELTRINSWTKFFKGKIALQSFEFMNFQIISPLINI